MVKQLSAKKFAKKLSPETLLQIQRQKLNKDQIRRALISEVLGFDALSNAVGTIERWILSQNLAFVEKTGADARDFLDVEMAIKIDALTNYAVPGNGESYDKLRLQFAQACMRGGHDHLEPRILRMGKDERIRPFDDEMMKAAFDRACMEHRSKIIRKCYKGKKKDFKNTCQAFQVDLETFSSLCQTLYEKALESHPYKEIRDSLPELDKIAGLIKDRTDLSTLCCWECDEVIDCPEVCSDCRAARYCGAVCQKNAWKKGHRFSCSSIKKIYENIKKNHNIVKAALADPRRHEHLYGYLPNNRIDYLLMFHPFHHFPADNSIELLSMERFYYNLAQAKKGLLWCDHPFDKPDLESAILLEFDDDTSMEHVIRNGLALSHQYSEYSPDETMENFKIRNSQLHSNWLTGGTTLTEHKADVNCTAAEFIKAYTTWEHPASYDRIFKEYSKVKAFESMKAYDKFVGIEGITKKAVGKVMKRKRKVLAELHERHLYKLRVQVEMSHRELTSARKSMMHLELKALFLGMTLQPQHTD